MSDGPMSLEELALTIAIGAAVFVAVMAVGAAWRGIRKVVG